jgi:hypothetical protein
MEDIKALRGSSIKLGFRKINSNLFGDAASNYNGKQGRLVALQGLAIDKQRWTGQVGPPHRQRFARK